MYRRKNTVFLTGLKVRTLAQRVVKPRRLTANESGRVGIGVGVGVGVDSTLG